MRSDFWAPDSGRAVELVSPDDVRSAVDALEFDELTGNISPAEASRRISRVRRAVTPRELWKASGGRAGAKPRQDWWDIRKTVVGILFLLVLAALGMWVVTIGVAAYSDNGGGGSGDQPGDQPGINEPAAPD